MKHCSANACLSAYPWMWTQDMDCVIGSASGIGSGILITDSTSGVPVSTVPLFPESSHSLDLDGFPMREMLALFPRFRWFH